LLAATPVRLATALVVLAAGGTLVSPGVAAAAGPPVTIGPGSSDWQTPPAVAVDASGTAYVAWVDPGQESVDYCVLPNGASSCSPAGTLEPEFGLGSSTSFDLQGELQVVIAGGEVSVLATADASGEDSTNVPTLEWQAPDGTANFAPVDGGDSIAATLQSPGTFSSLEGAVALPGGSGIGTYFINPDGPPMFAALPVTNPPTCSYSSSPPPCPYATLESPQVTPDPFSNFAASDLASVDGPTPAVLGVQQYWPGRNPDTCSDSGREAAFFYGTGSQSETNNYNVSAGHAHSAWKVTTKPLPGSCGYIGGALAGGASGLGLIEDAQNPNDSQTDALIYEPFDQATQTFDKPAVTAFSNSEWGGVVANYLTLSQDQSGGLFAVMYGNDPGAIDPNVGPQNVLFLFYSSDGGQTWRGPAPLDPTLLGNDTSNEPVTTSDVGADGIGWVVRRSSSMIQAMQFSAADAANQASATIATQPVSKASTVTMGLRCYAVPCQVQAALTAHVPTASKASARQARRRPSVLGRAHVVLSKHGVRRVVFRLTRAGRKLLKAHHGKLRAAMVESTTLLSFRQTRTISVKIRRHKIRRHR
jgi:hypothetical protein